MGKKKNSMSLLYLIGMIAVVVGCFLPIIEVKLGPFGSIKTNVIRAFQSLDTANSWWQLLMFVAAIVGAVLIFFVLVVLVPCIQVYMGNFLFSAYGV